MHTGDADKRHPEALVSAKEAARRLAVSRRTIDRLVAAGALPRVKVASRSVRFRPEDIEQFISARSSPR